MIKLDEILKDCEVVVELDEIRFKEKEIAKGVKLFVFESGQAALEFGHSYIEFNCTQTFVRMINEIDEVKAFDLLQEIGINTL